MKYIKYFESNYRIPTKSSEVREFCENYLAFLIDDGFRLVIYFNSEKSLLITLLKDFGASEPYFKLSDIEDVFIPFMEILSKEYNVINNIEITTFAASISNKKKKEFDISDIINDKTELNTVRLKSLTIFIEGNIDYK